ncbi:MAG: cell division protein FtsZ [Pseudomonadota bacterium]
MTLNLRIAEQSDLKPRITVFGVGGAGGNAVNNMIEQELAGADFVVANTDAQAMQGSKANNKIQLGAKVTEGLGAGAKPEVGRAAAEESLEEIVDTLAGSHMVFITGGMGGGTGTGAAPVVARAAREMGILTVGVVTKPFQFEGSKRMRLAEAGVSELQAHVDTLIIIPNQNLFRLANEKTTFSEAFMMADDVLYQGVKGVTDLMVRPGIINLDFADVRSVMDEMGKAMMGTGEASGEDRAVQAAEKAIANPLLDEISLKGARGVLINITGGDDLTLFELDEAANRIRSEVDPDANIIVGSTLDPSLQGVVRVSVVATGIDVETQRKEVMEARREAERMIAARPAPAPIPEPVAVPQQSVMREEVAPAPMPAPTPAPQAAPAPMMQEPEQAGSLFAVREEPVAPQPVAHAPSEGFIAPQPSMPGEPSPETLARLQRAVEKVPEGYQSRQRPAPAPAPVQQEPQMRPQPVAEPAEDRSSLFGIGSLMSRMSGVVDRDEPHAQRTPPKVAPAPDGLDDDERERMEIPAFLRRQAN